MMINAVNVARVTTCRRSDSVMPCVMVRNTGMVPSGLVNVKNDVRHNKRKGNNVSILTVII